MTFFLPFPVCALPDNTHRYIIQADQELLEENYENAINKYFKGILYASWKEKIEVWDDLGFAYLKKREFNKAKTYLLQSLSVRPENFNPRLYLAVAYILSGETSSASEHLKVIEKNVFFDTQWLDESSDLILRKPNGKEVKKEELQWIRNERGVYLQKISESERIIHLDAFDERNESAFHFTQGIVSKLNEELDKAEKNLLMALDSGYNELEVRMQLADVYYRQGRNGKAEEQIKKAPNRLPAFPVPLPFEIHIQHKLDPPNNQLLMVYHKKFLKELEKGKIDEAITILVKALEVHEQSFLINHNLGLLYFDTDQIEQAEVYCGRALWFKDDYILKENQIIGCHDLMGNIYFHEKKFEKALNEFNNILKVDEKNAAAHYNLGNVSYVLGNHKDAEHKWKKAIECEGASISLIDERKASKDELDISLTVKKESISFLSLLSLAQLYLEQEKIDKAAEECKKAIKLKPRDPRVYFILAKISLNRKEIKKAKLYLEKFLYLGGKENEEVKEFIASLKKLEK